MGSIGNPRDYLIITNNPLVVACMEGKILGTIEFHEGVSYRDILVMVRDKVYAGHTLYTHPLAGSVKPNETPYKSVVVSIEPHGFDALESELISNALGVCDKFKPIGWQLAERHHKDFQLIDYTLLCGALDFDAIAGLSKANF